MAGSSKALAHAEISNRTTLPRRLLAENNHYFSCRSLGTDNYAFTGTQPSSTGPPTPSGDEDAVFERVKDLSILPSWRSLGLTMTKGVVVAATRQRVWLTTSMKAVRLASDSAHAQLFLGRYFISNALLPMIALEDGDRIRFNGREAITNMLRAETKMRTQRVPPEAT
jgi:hypothetical protein